jgi:uncharacterized protein
MIATAMLFDLDRLARQSVAKYPRTRAIFSTLASEQGRHLTGILGPRGAGKTVLLKQLALATADSLYVSVDTVGETDLFELARDLQEKHAIKLLLLDEVHGQPGYPQMLKKIYDFLSVRVVFSSSVALSLSETAADLSRRVKLVKLFPFSFREYVTFKTGDELPSLTLADIVERRWQPAHLRYEALFDPYLRGGLMPFALEETDLLPLLRNIVQKVVTADIPAVVRLMVDELPLIQKCLAFIGRAAVEGVNYSTLSRNVGITKYKAEAYVRLLEKAFILNPVFPIGANVLREPKILMSLPYRLLYTEPETALGGLREDFFAEAMRMNELPFDYLKSTRGAKTPDFCIHTGNTDLVVEIGGRGKGRRQFKGIEVAKSLIFTHSLDTDGLRRPLLLLGFLGT